MVFAQIEGPAGSGGLLGGLVSVSVLMVIYFAWKFFINARTIEQGMRKRRTTDARAARYEAGLWQARCADLEYRLRQNGITIPDLSSELREFVDSRPDNELLPMPWDGKNSEGERTT